MNLLPQLKDGCVYVAAMLIIGALVAAIPAVFGWGVLPAFGVLTLVVLTVIKAFSLLDKRILNRQRQHVARSGSH